MPVLKAAHISHDSLLHTPTPHLLLSSLPDLCPLAAMMAALIFPAQLLPFNLGSGQPTPKGERGCSGETFCWV